MKALLCLAVFILALWSSLAPAQPVNSETRPAPICMSAQLTGQLLGICDLYVAEYDCPAPANHGTVGCAKLRRLFHTVSNGLDLDEILEAHRNRVSDVIPPGGGSISLPEIAEIHFPGGAFEIDTTVEIATASNEETNQIFEEFASIFRPSSRLNYEITVKTGSAPPLSETINVEVHLPEEFSASIPEGYGVELFALVEQASDLDLPFRSFELFESYWLTEGKSITAELPSAIFFRDEDEGYKAVLILAPTPGEKITQESALSSALAQLNAESLSTSECKASSIQCPVDGGCEVTSPYQPARRHPVTGVVRPHYGVDYRAATGTTLFAAAGGTVERSYTSRDLGETIVIRHDDGGATLYAHLQRRDVQVGDAVDRGSVIGTANNTGAASAGPHLHLEYVPNGQIILSKSRIDPHACIDSLASGSVTVSDSGTLADDAFGVSIDGFLIGQTEIGASNTLAISNLRPGPHVLALEVLIAPDNVGTYRVQLNDGLIFTNGSTVREGTAARGAILTWPFEVP